MHCKQARGGGGEQFRDKHDDTMDRKFTIESIKISIGTDDRKAPTHSS